MSVRTSSQAHMTFKNICDCTVPAHWILHCSGAPHLNVPRPTRSETYFALTVQTWGRPRYLLPGGSVYLRLDRLADRKTACTDRLGVSGAPPLDTASHNWWDNPQCEARSLPLPQVHRLETKVENNVPPVSNQCVALVSNIHSPGCTMETRNRMTG